MPVGGKLLLKGGEPLQLEKKIKKKKKMANKEAEEAVVTEGMSFDECCHSAMQKCKTHTKSEKVVSFLLIM